MIYYRDAHFTKQVGFDQWDLFLEPVLYPAVLKEQFPIGKGKISTGMIGVATRIEQQLNEAVKLQKLLAEAVQILNDRTKISVREANLLNECKEVINEQNKAATF